MAGERVEKTVFISYRRTNAPWALAIYQNLMANGFDVFFDYTGIASGDFEQVILGNIRGRAHFLLLLTPSALERCSEQGDWLRREIETALDSTRNIIPLMLEGFDFGSPAIAPYLTDKLSILGSYNGLNVPADYFFEAMDRLRNKHLNVPLSSVYHPVSPAAATASAQQKVAASTAPPVQPQELTAQQWFERGYSAKDPDEQIRCYSEAIRLKPDFGEALHNRGHARSEKGDTGGAIKDFDEAIRVRPYSPEALVARGAVQLKKGDFKAALRDCERALTLDPMFGCAFDVRGCVYFQAGDLKSAARDFHTAVSLGPKFGEHFFHRGVLKEKLGDWDGAKQDFKEAERLGFELPKLPISD